MIAGMVTVFSFLIILILCLHAMSAILSRFPDPLSTGAQLPQPDPRKIIAAATAVHMVRHRK